MCMLLQLPPSKQLAQQITHAHQQHLERLRYEAQLWPSVSSIELILTTVWWRLNWRSGGKRLWSNSNGQKRHKLHIGPSPNTLACSQLRAARRPLGPLGSICRPVFQQGTHVSQRHKKALLRALIDKVVVHRLARDRVQVRIVWKGGETTTLLIPVPVGALKDLAGAETMERIILERSAAGVLDEMIAQELTESGAIALPWARSFCPAASKAFGSSTGNFQKRSQSHPRRIEGALTISQLATALDIDPHWIYDRIHNGTIQVDKDPKHALFLVSGCADTIEQFQTPSLWSVPDTCVFQGGIKMHDRTPPSYPHRRPTSCGFSGSLYCKFSRWHHDTLFLVGTRNYFPRSALPSLVQEHF